MPRRKRILTSGAMRMKELGKKQVQLWLSQEDYEKLKKAADWWNSKLPRFIIDCAMEHVKQYYDPVMKG